MRTLEAHIHAKQFKRSQGHSSVAAAAYRSGSKIYDERRGEWHDYTKKQGVEHTRIYLPDNAPARLHEVKTQEELRSLLWNACEVKENRKNSQTAHELEVGFPAEFNAMQRREAGDVIAKELVRRYGCAVDIAYHAPSKDGDQRNYHAHIMFTQRAFDPARPDGWDRTKYAALRPDTKDAQGRPYLDWKGEATTRGALEVEDLRKFTAGAFNRIAERENLQVRSEYQSLERRGIEREPTQKQGPHATDIERKGEASRIGDENRGIRAANDNRDRLREAENVVDLERERVDRELAQLTRAELADLMASKHQHYDYHRGQVEDARDALREAKARLQQITFMQWATGQRKGLEADIEAKQRTLDNAQARMAELVSEEDIERFEKGREHSPALHVTAGQIRAQKAAEYALARDQYQKDQKELKAIEGALESRTKAERVIGAVTGRTKAQKARLDELRAALRSFESRAELQKSYRETQARENEQAAIQKHDREDKDRQAREEAERAATRNVIAHDFEDTARDREDHAEQTREALKRYHRECDERERNRDHDRDLE